MENSSFNVSHQGGKDMRGQISRLTSAFLLFILIAGIMACAATMYGVPEDQWNRMTDSERQAAVERYNERMRLREIERQREAEREAREAEIRAAEARRQEMLRHERIEAIYRGEAGQYGDLIRVTIQGGEVRIARRHRNYHPVSFKIADGERKKVQVIHDEGKYGTYEDLEVLYADGVLYIDTYDTDTRGSLRIVYEPKWKAGTSYGPFRTESKLQFRNVQVAVEIIPHLHKKRY